MASKNLAIGSDGAVDELVKDTGAGAGAVLADVAAGVILSPVGRLNDEALALITLALALDTAVA